MEPDETKPNPSSTLSILEAPADWPLKSSTSTFEEKIEDRKPLWIRQPPYFENAEPPSPLNPSPQSAPLPKTSRMSLFNLFSKPKVERQRGYAEQGLDAPTRTLPTKQFSQSNPNLVAQAHAPSVLSLQTAPTRVASRWKSREPAKPPSQERKNASFDPPPLFQAYPQSMKEGTLEVSTMTVDSLRQKSKHKRGALTGVDLTAGDGTRSAIKHGTNGSGAHVELHRKVFVLVTSGYLLQYAENGPSDRIPERMLHLGKDSAAFACDLVPGQHYVLQVSQAVDQDGVLIASSGSLLSKLGLRSAASKRTTSSFLLVMESAGQMDSWMMAIRREIDNVGGSRMRPDLSTPITANNSNDTVDSPSQSHRFDVRRDPSKVSLVTSPVESPSLPAFPVPSPGRSPALEAKESDDDTATIDGIEIEASKLEESSRRNSPVRKRAPSDSPSITSSAAVSVEQHQLNNLRSSVSDSTRTSRTSQVGTVASPVATSRASSIAGSPPSEQPLDAMAEAPRENAVPLKSTTYRPMASHSMSRRRSGVPLPTPKEGQTLSTIVTHDTSPKKPRWSAIAESPVAGNNAMLSIKTSPKKSLTSARSAPNLHTASSKKAKHDSKMPDPPPVPSKASAADSERPNSLVGDLPSPSLSMWSSSRAPSRRSSVMQPLAAQASPSRQLIIHQAEPNRGKRISFSMPLKVNPSGVHSPTISGNNRRTSTLNDPDAASETPAVHTLTAKVDSSKRISTSQVHSNPASPNATSTERSRTLSPPPTLSYLPGQYQIPSGISPALSKRSSTTSPSLGAGSTISRAASASPRLSFLPSQYQIPTGISPVPPKRSSSATSPTFAQSQSQANGRALKRPTSMQVRSDHAPFLSSVRTSQSGPIDARATPIRGMKPSRSATNVAALARDPPPEVFKSHSFGTPRLSEEDDRATPLPDRALSPLPSRPGSRASGRRSVRGRSSLPELDLGLPVVGLGPPAPPPSAPLPLLPTGSRPSSPTPSVMYNTNAGIESVAGLGIRVS
ncbi:hypothetical protein LTR37_002897 [Vermiconidia calcicola]|uniref:Uncharacterized protein n=1 Tax=Vermiconidia calcicola TaxID=1690605 RepID=A0ACC3NRV4_9PEZI|nr:hypothetical protein LTR37_002897 [Vermiconidia calcicola]